MARRKGVSVRQRRVSTELRTWRIRRGLSCKEVARALGWSESKVSRMETGERGLYVDDVAAVLGFLRAPAEIRQDLLDLVRTGDERNWHEIGRDIPISRLLRDLIRFESEATAIHNFEPLLLPGLVQTAEYARSLMRMAAPTWSEHEIESMVAVRMNRQRVLDKADPPRLNLIVEEMVLRRTMDDPGMMVGQLQHLLAASSRRHISVRVLPFDTEAAIAAQGSLIMLECPDQPTLCYEESRTTSAFLEDEEFIGRGRLVWKKLSAAARSEDASRQLIADLVLKLRSAL
ncbi:MAG: helix-turn-helix transcriptional regulator [Actinophytocola sp.]|uniref:helix-turn-helix domain-containing protein n=1 Tax=Actinophytocola sp. TaxID=1872138 RepID=UPI003C7542C4